MKHLVSDAAAAQDSTANPWIECDGAGCPVSDCARVHVQFRYDPDRETAELVNPAIGVPAYVYGDCWIHQGAKSDIVACRVVA
ncbi:hypothetical protein [Sphingomonas sp. Ant20]|uniref:hypothetical protein n=1 Tax=Sphingomonas sp. Ant20 TaxID=104605 RepID=UPI000536E007|nr:hypothetical protein [Sphingomonas sp. Ant20]KHA63413.1 hypothetical protein NI18_15990 [Sphingomonas sp. Ant20]